MGKIAVGGKNLPAMAYGHGTHEHINRRTDDPGAPAIIRHSSCFFVVNLLQWDVGEIAQAVANASKLRFIADAGKQFLARRSQHLNTALKHKVVERSSNASLG